MSPAKATRILIIKTSRLTDRKLVISLSSGCRSRPLMSSKRLDNVNNCCEFHCLDITSKVATEVYEKIYIYERK